MADLALPPLHNVADQSSLDAQARFLWATRIQLAALVVAAVGSAITLEVDEVRIGSIVALAGFLVALSVRGYLLATRPERAWYEGRAAAESVKTLAWRYSIGGHPFADSVTESAADALFIKRCAEILRDLETLDAGSADVGPQVTSEMRRMRAMSLPDRKQAYDQERLLDQQRWYGKMAKWNKERSGRWQIVLVVIEVIGLLAALARVAGWIDIDVLGVAAACSAAATAWMQARQHEQLAAAYALTAQELANVRALVEPSGTDDGASWAIFVQDAEEAISREHTMWRASRGVRLSR